MEVNLYTKYMNGIKRFAYYRGTTACRHVCDQGGLFSHVRGYGGVTQCLVIYDASIKLQFRCCGILTREILIRKTIKLASSRDTIAIKEGVLFYSYS